MTNNTFDYAVSIKTVTGAIASGALTAAGVLPALRASRDISRATARTAGEA